MEDEGFLRNQDVGRDFLLIRLRLLCHPLPLYLVY